MVQVATKNKGSRLNVTIREMDAHDIKFPEGTFDVVTAVQTAHHWADQGAVIGEVFRVLKPGGRFYLYEADREQDEIPEGWIQRRSGWPPRSVVIAGWRRFGMNENEWAEACARAQATDFSTMVVDRHGFYRRMVMTK